MNTEPKSREVRLGLVMYGGVSLAIYINGVAREFFEAVRGRGVYRLIKALTDSDVVVDVISGTSAGGINGLMLAYALGRGRDFSAAADLWRENGDFARLLRGTSEKGAPSLLDSEGFYQSKLEDVFRQIELGFPDRDGDPSLIAELDLFITGTDVDGRISTQFDDAGHPIDVKDHRAVFHLRHRAAESESFADKKHIMALAKLSRITSCFPAAFAPVSVTRTAPEDLQLRSWGQLDPERDVHFLDGGVLDNKPFTHTLKAIFARSAERQVQRKLFYVEPDPECFESTARTAMPNVFECVLAALVGIPGYESIADDLKLLTARNSKLEQYNRLLHNFAKQPLPPGEAQRQLYHRARCVALSERVIRGILKDKGSETHIEAGDRKFAAELVRQFDEVEPTDAILDLYDIARRLRRFTRLIYFLHEHLYSNATATLSPARRDHYHKLWAGINDLFAITHVLHAAVERLLDTADIRWKTAPDAAPENAETEAKDCVAGLWDTVKAALLRLLDAPDLCQAIDTSNTGTPALRLQAVLRQRTDALIEEFALPVFDRRPADQCRSFLLDLDERAERLMTTHTTKNDLVYKAWKSFPDLDIHLYPLEVVGGLQEKDIIETIRISPLDARRGFSANSGDQHTFRDKIAGDAFFHFGGFFKRSWRSNDILWGRLDSLGQLVETLLDTPRLEKIAGQSQLRTRLRARLFTTGSTFHSDFDPATLFPKSGPATQQKLASWLDDFLSPDDAIASAALGTDPATGHNRFDRFLELLISAAQLEVLVTDLPLVLRDALLEQYQWNQFRVPRNPSLLRRGWRATADLIASSPGSPAPAPDVAFRQHLDRIICSSNHSPLVFQPGHIHWDTLYAASNAEERISLLMWCLDDSNYSASTPPPDPKSTRLGRFFLQGYRVGKEEWQRDIPAAVLLELLAHSLLVARNCLLNAAPNLRGKIETHPLYVFGLKIPLRVFYIFAVLNRRRPGLLTTLLFGLFFLCPVVWAMGYLFRQELLSQQTGHAFPWKGWLVFVIVPFILMCFVIVAAYWRAERASRPTSDSSPS